MAGPWERYQGVTPKAGPWAKYQSVDFSGVSAKAESTADLQGGETDTGIGRLITGRQQEPSFTQRVGRELGLGARGMIQGAYGLAGTLGGDIASSAEAAARGIPYRSTREAGVALADTLGLPSPQSSTERVGGDVTEALTGGAGLMGAGRILASKAPSAIQTVANRVGDTLQAMPKTQVASLVGGSTASGVTRELGGGQGAQIAAGLVGGLTPAGLAAAAPMALRGLARGGEVGRQTMQQTINDFRSVGAEPSVGQATGNFRTQGAESLLAGGPTSAGVMSRAAEQQADNIGAGLQSKADKFFPNASAERAGRAVERGAETLSKNIKATKRALYWQADQFIPEATPVPLSNTWQTVAKLTAPTPGAVATTEALINPRISQLRQTLETDLAAGGGQIPYAALKRIRTDIGEQLTDFSLSPDTPTRELKQLYASLSRDMEAAAQSRGPNAVQAAKRANTYTRAAADRMEQVQRVIDKNGGPEKVFDAVMSGTQDGGTTLRAVMQSLPKEGQRAVTGAVIKRMGLATPGQQGAAGDTFSAQTFLTNWNRVSPEAKRALFDRHGPAFSADMDKLARVADRIRSGSKVFANPAGTTNRGAALTYAATLGGSLLTGQLGALATLAGSGAMANLMARAMTNPRMVAWLAKASTLPVSSIPQQVITLKGIADRTGDEDFADMAALLESSKKKPDGSANAANKQN